MSWSFLTNLPIALAFAWLWALLAFLIGRVKHRNAIIDVYWGAGFLVIYLESFRIAHAGYSHLRAGAAAPSYANRYIVLAFVALWGLRLAIYLARRDDLSAHVTVGQAEVGAKTHQDARRLRRVRRDNEFVHSTSAAKALTQFEKQPWW